MTESDGSLPEGGSTGKDLLGLLKGCPRSQERRLYRVALGPKDSGNWYSTQTKGYQFLPLRKLNGNQPILIKPTVHLAHLEEEDSSDNEDQESDDPSRVREEFMVCLQGPLRMPKQTKNTATIVATQNISSVIAPW